MDLKTALHDERIRSYARLRGGFPIPLAGALWWLVLAALGTRLDLYNWSLLAFVASGLIFPLALLLARLFRNDFMKVRTVTTDALIPAFISMLLFWAIAFGAFYEAQHLVPLVLAVGMSIHWPVIGWTYARTALFSAHAVVRAVASLAVWTLFPDDRTVYVPLVVSAIYFVTVVAILIDSGALRSRLDD